MKLSFLIVTKNRPDDLSFTLNKLKSLIDLSLHEVLVFIDDCKTTEAIVHQFDWVNWTISKKPLSASPSRSVLYKKAKGAVFIGLDDDAHPISEGFINNVEKEFGNNERLGIIAFQEVRGLFKTDGVALQYAKLNESYFTNDFIGCGFAIRKSVYNITNGFPVWINIYGEEPALALEVLNLNYQILFCHNIVVNHRIDIEKRKLKGRNYFRFEQQLRNSIRCYLVYYPNPIIKIVKLLVHNFGKYALSDFKYFKLFFKVCFSTLFQIFNILKYRRPIKKSTLQHRLTLRDLKY
ncbi:glycosyltransferase family 2 protein [Flavivirga jejuensis]|uniref:Glycosyltransferase family 2 protein n=1 Tax=Flavivirga jejuensis TaxID=870487 RepID=A0ABT8WU16_9FLAO|nr:glycosyltransferase family 2 protein [Flavivirga jejuensis]MDO5976663.1 glycosyltransferase family 2 protein [Flavivirga jejuensis]